MPVAPQCSQGIGSFSVIGLIVVRGVKRPGTPGVSPPGGRVAYRGRPGCDAGL